MKTDVNGIIKEGNVLINTDVTSLQSYKKQKEFYRKINTILERLLDFETRLTEIERKTNRDGI